MDDQGRLRVAMTVEQCWQPVPGGSGTYIRELVREYAAMPDLDVTGIAAWHRLSSGTPEGLHDLRVRRLPLPRPVLYEAWQRVRHPRGDRRSDVTHATTWAVPGTRAPLVVTVHDLAFLHDPGHFTPRGVRFFERALALTRDEAAAVIVPSHATRDDCLDQGIEAGRLHVVAHGVRRPPTAGSPAEFRELFGLRRPYVLWAGTREPRKNLPVLLSAFALALEAGADLDLVLAGPEGWGPERDRLTRTQEERVHVLGRLPWAQLQQAYAGAHVFCYPSLREGYGMPVTEAMAHGVPVVTSRGTATEEAAGGAAVLVDPHDVEDVARGLLEACQPVRHAHLSQASTARAEGLDWSVTARATASVLRGAASSRGSG